METVVTSPSSRTPPTNSSVGNGSSLKLVGSIVEKGFSDTSAQKFRPTPFPNPTVLPFPLARHRSHGGPQYAPIENDMDINEANTEDMDDSDFDPVSVFPHPIQRRKKQDLDFRRWREMVSEDGSVLKQQKKNNNTPPSKSGEEIEGSYSLIEKKSKSNDLDLIDITQTEVMKETGQSIPPYPCLPVANAFEHKKMNDHLGSDICLHTLEDTCGDEISYVHQRNQCGMSSTSTHGFCDEEMADTLFTGSRDTTMNEIDIENQIRLREMAPEEIAEAQSEIMEKLDKKMIEMLKKRGRKKLEKNKSERKVDECVEPPPIIRPMEKDLPKASGCKASSTDSNWKPTDVHDGSSWKEWSERVERTRALRFDLDGNVVAMDSFVMTGKGKIPEIRQYNDKNVSERDFLRTEGDPGGAGYTIKEAVALIRSMIPGQRALALHLLASVLNNALSHIKHDQIQPRDANDDVDWQAVWAFSLGPEPEVVLSLRMALDDNHISVVLACSKAIECLLSCDVNESFFNLSEKSPAYDMSICTAPVFRNRPEIKFGFLHGGFWKYNTKPSNLQPFGDKSADNEKEGGHTVQDDVVVSGQDVVAGLIRMGILPRICYLFEMDPTVALEESLLSILIALARHSPSSADAIMKCPRLVQTIVNRFMEQDALGVHPSKIKSVILLKILAQSNKKYCIDFIQRGYFLNMMRHFYRHESSLVYWRKLGKEQCKLASSLMIEQLRFWKVCIQYGYCLSYFEDFFPAICLWLNPPTFEILVENNILPEFTSVASEAYLTLASLATRLPTLHSKEQLSNQSTDVCDETENWAWGRAVAMVEMGLNWISWIKNSKLYTALRGDKKSINMLMNDPSLVYFLWVISSVVHMLSNILKRITPVDILEESGPSVPWLPAFVPKIGIKIVESKILKFSKVEGKFSLVEALCYWRNHSDSDLVFSSVCCLREFVQLISLLDKLIKVSKIGNPVSSIREPNLSNEENILNTGLAPCAMNDLRNVLVTFTTSICQKWPILQSIEMFGRGGPAPGIGVGWGSLKLGFWSKTILMAQLDADLVTKLHEIIPIFHEKNIFTNEEITLAINCALTICLVGGPRDVLTIERAFSVLFQVPVFSYLNYCIHSYLNLRKGKNFSTLKYKEDDYSCFSENLKVHFRNRWLNKRQKLLNKRDHFKNKSIHENTLTTIDEESDMMVAAGRDLNSCTMTEWAYQRLPLPCHWFLSPICTMDEIGSSYVIVNPCTNKLNCLSTDILDVATSGLFLLLGLETMTFHLPSDAFSPVRIIPLIFKLHALSMVLLVKMDVLGDERGRESFNTLQDLYGHHLDELRQRSLESGEKHVLSFLEIHESYATFTETLVDQFSAISYGDILFGRQIALYLQRVVEVSTRLAVWNALSSAHVLELLPPLDHCISEAYAYLDPIEDNENILEAYAKSLVSGSLDRAVTRKSVTFTLALHHLSSFIFLTNADAKPLLRNKLVKIFLRHLSFKQEQKGMIIDLIRYIPGNSMEIDFVLQSDEIERRFNLLIEACEGNSSLLAEVQKLRSSL